MLILSKILKTIFWCFVLSLIFTLIYVKLPYFSFKIDLPFFLSKKGIVSNFLWKISLYLHITSGLLAALTGTIQFFTSNNKKWTNFHKLNGKLYIFLVLFIAAPSAFYLSFFASATWWIGFEAQLRFFILVLLWSLSTYLSYHYIKKKNYVKHRRWMIRSYVLTMVDISGRLWAIILTIGFHPAPLEKALLILWLSLIVNIIIGEMIIYLFSSSISKKLQRASI